MNYYGGMTNGGFTSNNSFGGCGCNATYTSFPAFNGCSCGGNNTSYYAIILVLFILLVIVIGSRFTR